VGTRVTEFVQRLYELTAEVIRIGAEGEKDEFWRWAGARKWRRLGRRVRRNREHWIRCRHPFRTIPWSIWQLRRRFSV